MNTNEKYEIVIYIDETTKCVRRTGSQGAALPSSLSSNVSVSGSE